MKQGRALQDQIPNNHCFGCGPTNPHGLHLKSFWIDEDRSACKFVPLPHHSAGPTRLLNGGIISTIIDCHCVCTAIAKGYQMLNRDIGKGEPVWFATGKLEVSFLKPVRIDHHVELVASVDDARSKKISLTCNLYSDNELCCTGQVIAVKVPNSWFDAGH